jgi:nucleosome binding factor SPN SPT16 subunit
VFVPAFLFERKPITRREPFMAKHKKTERKKELDRRRRRKEKSKKLLRKEETAHLHPAKRAKTTGR